MKKVCLSLFIALLSTASAFAQSQIGLRAGANFATIQDGLDKLENIEEEPWVSRFTIGVATNLYVNESFSIAPEFNYSKRGYMAEGKFTTLGGEGDFTYEYDYNFFEVPLLARLYFGPKILKGYLNLGPTFSYLMSGRERQEGRIGILAPGERDIDVENDKYNRFEIGGAVGAGIQLNTGIGSFLIDLRYHTGFTNIQESGFTLNQALGGKDPEKYRTQYVSTTLIVLVPGIR